MTDRADLIALALNTWAPDYPRRVTRTQEWVDNPRAAAKHLLDAEQNDEDSPFISVYSFPRGHTKGDNVPDVNTLFIDFDIEDGDYERGSGDRAAWKRDMSELLVRVRKVADLISEMDKARGWRASLSGHKGVHLFVDFPTLDPDIGEFDQFVGGMNAYAVDLVEKLASETGMVDLDEYVDVTSSDMGRLCRVPNTLHGGATDSFGEARYCVPVTIEELGAITADRYEELTRQPREPTHDRREPLEDVADVLSQYITNSDATAAAYASGRSSTVNWSRVEEYKEQQNENLTLEDVRTFTSDMPCVWEFHLRDDKYRHGNQSHEMETHCIAKLLQLNFPIEVIKEFLSNADEYNEQYTEDRIHELIARDFKPYSMEKIMRRAPEFFGTDGCRRCQRALDGDQELQRIVNT